MLRAIIKLLGVLSFPIFIVIFAFISVADVRSQQEQLSINERLHAAKTHWEEGEGDKALDVYEHIIERYGPIDDAYHGKGIYLNHFKNCLEALEHYEEYLKQFPDSPRGIEGYGIAKEC